MKIEEDTPSIFPPNLFSDFVSGVADECRLVLETTDARSRRFPIDLANVMDETIHMIVHFADQTVITGKLVESLLRFDLLTLKHVWQGKDSNHAPILLAETYFWSSFCLLAYECGEVVGGSSALASILEILLNRFNAFVLAVFVLPLFVHTLLRKSVVSDDTRRMWTFAFAFSIGLLLSYSDLIHFGSEDGTSQPPLFLLPFMMGCVCCLTAYYTLLACWRILFLLPCSTAPFLVYYIWLSKTCKNFDHISLSWSFTFWQTAVIAIQLKLGRMKRRWTCESLEQWWTTIIFVAARLIFLVVLLLGGRATQPR